MVNGYSYKDPGRLAKTLLILLFLGAVLDTVAVFSDSMQYDLLVSVRDGEKVTHEEAVANDSRQNAVGLGQLILVLITAVFFLSWVYRMSWNAHSIETADLKHTPGWAVGYFFIPILNLWKPYQALREAYDAFAQNAYERKNNLVFPLWWFAWVTAGLAGRAVFRGSTQAETLEDLMEQTSLAMGLDALNVFLDIMALLLVMMVTNTCVRSFERSGMRGAQRVTPRPALYSP